MPSLSYLPADGSTLEIVNGIIRIKDQGVTAAKILNGTITATQIANSTITGTQIGSNINLAGTAVQAASKNVVVSSTNASTGLAIIRGYVRSDGVIIAGEGFTVTTHSVSGQYGMTWTVGFSAAPVLVCTALSAGNSNAATAPGTSVSGGAVYTYDSAGTNTDQDFCFFAIGPR